MLAYANNVHNKSLDPRQVSGNVRDNLQNRQTESATQPDILDKKLYVPATTGIYDESIRLGLC